MNNQFLRNLEAAIRSGKRSDAYQNLSREILALDYCNYRCNLSLHLRM
jgi:hypothetical protein